MMLDVLTSIVAVLLLVLTVDGCSRTHWTKPGYVSERDMQCRGGM